MSFGVPFKDLCEKKLSPMCKALNGEQDWIVNKSRWACGYCNTLIKKGNKAKKLESKDKLNIALNELEIIAERKGRTINKNASADQSFFREVWDEKCDSNEGCRCEECGVFLPKYSASFLSHIISKGSEPLLRHDKRNINILCLKCHHLWEFGQRNLMRIYENNLFIIQSLKEYVASLRRNPSVK